MEKVNNINYISCTECNFKSKLNIAVKTHKKREHGVKVKIEKVVDEIHNENDKSNLKQGQDREKEHFACNQCEYKSPYNLESLIVDDIKNHKKSHHIEQYVCEERNCKYQTYFKNKFGVHVRQNHGTRCYICNMCPYTTMRKQRFVMHIESAHNKEETNGYQNKIKYACEEKDCNYKSTDKKKVKHHVKRQHGKMCYICAECPFTTQSKQYFKQHIKRAHNMLITYPLPPRPVLSMTTEETKSWFPSFFSILLSDVKSSTQKGHPMPSWMKDIEDVISFSTIQVQDGNWGSKENNFFWKLKLVSAIVLENKGIDYTEFALDKRRKHTKYSVTDLKMMSKAKNHATFENLFL